MAWQKTGIVALTSTFVVGVAYFLAFHLLGMNLPRLATLRAQFATVQVDYADRKGNPLKNPEKQGAILRGPWVELTGLSPQLVQKFSEMKTNDLSLELVRLMQGQDRRLFAQGNWIDRFRHHSQARALAARWSRSELLEAYLNLSFFRMDIQGVHAASLEFFNKRPEHINGKEAALLKSFLTPTTRLRPLRRAVAQIVPPLIWAQPVKGPEKTVQTTIDARLQRTLEALAKRQSPSIIVLDNTSGDVVAAVGEKTLTTFQAGGVLAPFVFALALDRHQLTLLSKLRDSPLWNAANREFHEVVTARTALNLGLPIPTVGALDVVGVDQYVDLLRELGFTNMGSVHQYGSALGLGEIGVDLIDVTNAYRTLANQGRYSLWNWQSSKASVQSRTILSEEAVYLVNDALTHDSAKPDQWVVYQKAQITPQTQWSVGFSSRWTVGVVTDHAGAEDEALQVWRETMKHLRAYDHSPAPLMPAQVIRKLVALDSKQSVSELFVVGTEPKTRSHQRAVVEDSHIIYPVDLSTLTFDPQLPKTTARIFFQVHPENQNLQWVLNGRVIGKAREFLSWAAQEGEYQLNLQDGNGRIVDQVRFNVKATQKANPSPQGLTHGLSAKRSLF
jgi:penicillin-binding protein 1C